MTLRQPYFGSVALCVLLSTLPATLRADDNVKLDGDVFLGEEGCPGGIKSKDCVLTFEITGKSAKILFDGMRVKAVREECTGGMQKVDGNGLNCIKGDDGKYNCDFGYDFAKKQFGGSAVSC